MARRTPSEMEGASEPSGSGEAIELTRSGSVTERAVCHDGALEHSGVTAATPTCSKAATRPSSEASLEELYLAAYHAAGGDEQCLLQEVHALGHMPKETKKRSAGQAQ